MPHDRDGKRLEAGDEVMIPARIQSVQAGEHYCNVTLETLEPMCPTETKSCLHLNAKQVVKVIQPPAPATTASMLLAIVLFLCASSIGSADEPHAGAAPSVGPLTTIDSQDFPPPATAKQQKLAPAPADCRSCRSAPQARSTYRAPAPPKHAKGKVRYRAKRVFCRRCG